MLLLTPGGTRSNTYYHMMFAPPLIVLAGVLYTSLPAVKWARYPAALALALSVAYSAYVGIALQRPVHQTAYDCGAWINEHTPEDALVLTSSPNPATLYFADRKGWTCWLQYYGEAIPFTPEVIEKVQALGASIVAIPDPHFDDDARYEPVRTWLNERFRRHVGEGFTIFYLDLQAKVAELPDPAVRMKIKELHGNSDMLKASYASGSTRRSAFPGNIFPARSATSTITREGQPARLFRNRHRFQTRDLVRNDTEAVG